MITSFFNIIKGLVVLIFAVILCSQLYGQNEADSVFDISRKFSTRESKEDLKVLKDSLEILHPALYRYTSKTALNSIFKKAQKSCKDSINLSKLYMLLAHVIDNVYEIHTSISLHDGYISYLATKSELFPFDVRVLNKHVFIANNNSFDSSIEVGSQLIKINKIPVSLILKSMMKCFSSEGDNETYKVKMAEQRFAFYLQVLYGYSKHFQFEYISKVDHKVKTKDVVALPFSTIKENRTRITLKYPNLKSLYPKPPYLNLLLNLPKKTAILTIKSFQNDILQNLGQVFKPFIDSCFQEIKTNSIKSLIIDIRNNAGGESENASYLYSYLTKVPFKFLNAMEATKKTFEDDKKRGVLYSVSKHLNNFITSDSSFASSQFFGLTMQQPAPNNFSGNVYVIIDGMTTSAAPQFASLIRLNKRGKLIGEEAPGALYGGCGRGYSYFYLPNSKLLVMISHYRLYMKSINSHGIDLCIKPDYQTKISIEDLLNGRDKDLELTLRLIDIDNKIKR